MPLWLSKWWDALRTTYWFLPLVMAVVAVALALGMIELDRHLELDTKSPTWWVYTGGPEGARGVMSTVAGSMITVAGVVFSITVVALSLAANQFGPRLLRNFIRDRPSQIVLGTFTATFLYCLLVLRAVRGTEEWSFVPHVSVALGILLGVASLGVFVFFIHHVATSIRVEAVIARLTHDLLSGIDRLWPTDLGKEKPEPEIPPLPPGDPAAVTVEGSGYVDAVNGDSLMSLASDHDLVIRLHHRPGQFIIAGAHLADVWPADRVSDGIRTKINEAVVLATQRSPFQDVGFVVDQFTEVAVRALSPSMNDPYTAEACIDRLGQGLVRAAGRVPESPFRSDDNGRLRVITRPTAFSDLIDPAFGRLREYAAGSLGVLGRAITTLSEVAARAQRVTDRAATLRHLDLLYQTGCRRLADEHDREALTRIYQEALAVANRPPNGRPTDI